MTEQHWYARWEKESGVTDDNCDLVAIIDKESNNSLAPPAYRHIFNRIKVFMERSQQRRPSGMTTTPPDTADTEKDYLYKDFATILQANYEDLEAAYRKEHAKRNHLEEDLTTHKLATLNLEQTLKTLRDEQQQQEEQHQEQQLTQQTQTKELLERLNGLEKSNALLEEELAKEQQKHKGLMEGMEKLVQRLTDQMKNKDAQLLSVAKQRQVMEVQMMDTHKELMTTQTDLTQKNNDILQISQLILVIAGLPPVRNTFAKIINEAMSPQALQTLLTAGSTHPQAQNHASGIQHSLLLIRQALYQQQNRQQQQQQIQQQIQQPTHQTQQPTQQQQQYHALQSTPTLASSPSSNLPYSNNNPCSSSSPNGIGQPPNQFHF